MIVKTNNTQGRKVGRKIIIRESISDKFVSLYNAPTRLEKLLEYFITVISWSFALSVKISFWLCIFCAWIDKALIRMLENCSQSTRTMHWW
jgi:hypothetical protein